MKFTVNGIEVNYSSFVAGLGKKHKTPEEDYLHGPVGIAKEAGELLDNAYRHWNYGKPLDATTRENVIEEAGDILFYLQMTLSSVGSSLDEALVGNIQKLWKRYPGGYTNADALARADKPAGQ